MRSILRPLALHHPISTDDLGDIVSGTHGLLMRNTPWRIQTLLVSSYSSIRLNRMSCVHGRGTIRTHEKPISERSE